MKTIAYALMASPVEGGAHAARQFGKTVAYRNSKMRQ